MSDQVQDLEARGGAELLPPGRRIGTYEILEPVGRGGMGIVYRAKDRSLDRDVALKVLLPHLTSDAEFEKRFVREARAAAKLDHPNIVQTYSAGRFENLLFIAMQFVKGRTLYETGKERGAFAPDEALRIIRQAAEALKVAHADGLVHRDIKPNNIMLDDAGRVKVMDFGLMRSAAVSKDHITQTGVFYGTPEYSSPEQCETSNLDGRSDIYSLGAVLYEMLTGKLPHTAETPLALFKKITQEEPKAVRSLNPAVPKPVERILLRMMARNRDERYPSCEALIADIDQVLSGGEPARTSRALRRPSPAIGAAMAVGAIAVAIAAAFLLSGGRLGGGPGLSALPPQPAAKALTLAVFDFKNGTGHPDAAWYEIAISDMLISSLGQRAGLRVPTRDQMLWKVRDLALGEKITSENHRRVLEELGADYYVVGSYYALGQRVRVNLNCYRRSDHAQAFDTVVVEKPAAEVFALIDEIAAGLVARLEERIQGLLTAVPGAAIEPVASIARGRMRSAPRIRPTAPKGAAATRGEARKLESLRESLEGADPRSDKELEKAADAVNKADGELEDAQASGGRDGNAWNLVSVGDVERMRHFYMNRRMAEKGGLEKDDVLILVENLADQLDSSWDDAARLQKGLENFQACVAEASAERAKQAAWSLKRSAEYFCLTCGGAPSPQAGACGACGAPLSLRIAVQVRETKKP